MQIEKRSLMVAPEIRAEGDSMALKGYAALFNSPAEIGSEWREVIAPGAFTDSLGGDIRALVDHDAGRPIGRTKSGTLRLTQDQKGLAVEIDLPNTSDGRDLHELVKRGDIDGMSFGFVVRHDEWDETSNPPTRTIHAVDLYEVSAVTWPAYADTELGLRSMQKSKEKTEEEKRAAEQRRLAYSRRKAETEQRINRIAKV